MPPQSVVPPQPAKLQSHKPDNIQPHTQSQKTPQPSPTTQSTQQSPIRTNTNPATQPFIPAAETHQSVSSSPLQHIPKSVNGEGMKSSKPENRSSAPDGQLCFHYKQPGHLKKDCPEQPYCSKCRTRGHIPAKCPSKQQNNRQTHNGREFREEARNQSHETCREEWKRSQHQPKFSHKDNRCLHCAGDHETHDCPTGLQHQALPLATMLEVQVFIKTQINSQTLHLNIVHTHSNTLNKVNPLLVNHTNTHGDQPTISTKFSTTTSSTSPTGQPTDELPGKTSTV